MEEQILLGGCGHVDSFCKLVEKINVSAIDLIAISNMKLTVIRIEKVWASML